MDKNILEKYFNATITDEELTILTAWIEESAENRSNFLAACRIWNTLEFDRHREDIDMGRELATFRENIGREIRKSAAARRRKIAIRSVAAACILAPILIIGIDRLRPSAPDDHDIMSFVNTTGGTDFTSSKDIQLILSDSKKVELGAESADIHYKDDRITMADNDDIAKEQSASFNQLLIPYGKRSTITFSDGTKVWANAGTRLVYPIEFGKKERRIFVDGQIFLDVAKEAARPFIVNTKDMDIRVLGTLFNITAYSNENSDNIVLVSGSVCISNKTTNSNTTLTPNEMYVYDKTNRDENVEDVNTALYTSWVNGRYLFDKEPFANVLARLSMYYGVTIDCEAAAGRFRCSGKLSLRDEFDTVIDGLANSVPISYTVEEGVYRIRLLK